MDPMAHIAHINIIKKFMNFKNKIITSIIIVFLLVISLLSSFFYLQKNNNLSEEKKSETKAECLKKVNKMNNEQLIEEVNNLDLINNDELFKIKEKTFNYLVCQTSQEAEWFDSRIGLKIYQKSSDLINKLNMPDKLTDDVLGTKRFGGMFYEWDENDENKIGIINREYVNFWDIPFKSTEEICPNGEINPDFLEICLFDTRNINESSIEQVEDSIKNYCYSLCDNIKLFKQDISYFRKGLNDLKWSDNYQFLYIMTATSFHIGGKELALELCDSVPDLNLKEECSHYVISLDYINCKDFGFNQTKECQLKEFEDCEMIYDQAKDLMCEFYSK